MSFLSWLTGATGPSGESVATGVTGATAPKATSGLLQNPLGPGAEFVDPAPTPAPNTKINIKEPPISVIKAQGGKRKNRRSKKAKKATTHRKQRKQSKQRKH